MRTAIRATWYTMSAGLFGPKPRVATKRPTSAPSHANVWVASAAVRARARPGDGAREADRKDDRDRGFVGGGLVERPARHESRVERCRDDERRRLDQAYESGLVRLGSGWG
jgi:hypothetical protein